MRKFCKGMIVFAHTKIAAVMLGGVMLLWSFIALGPPDSLFAATIQKMNTQCEWAAIMACNGILLLAGSLFPWRSLRHIGLALCCFNMTALGGFFFLQGLVTPVSVTMPYFGLMALITLMAEVKGKPRNGCNKRMA